MNRPTTTQNNRFFTREFIHLSFGETRQTAQYDNPAECYHRFRRGNNLSCRLLLPFIGLIECSQVWKVTVFLSIVESVADDESVRDFESHIFQIHLDRPTFWLAAQRSDVQ